MSTSVEAVVEFAPAISVFDKAGVMLGSIADYTISAPGTRVINGRGSMTFYVPRVSPDVVLLADDRLVAVQSELGDPLWAGTMTVNESGAGMLEVQCDDIFQLLADGMPITITEDVADNTPADQIMAQVMDLSNADRAANGEIQWGTSFGSSLFFRGDIDFEGSPLDAIEEIAARAGNEYIWTASLGSDVGGTHLSVTLVTSDYFSFPSSASFFDGPDGNIVSDPRVVRDASPVVNYIKVKGQSTDLTKYLPDWASWAIHDVTPEVVASVDPGPYRRRADLEVNVDWGLSKTAQRALAQQTLDAIWDLYTSYLRAIHDMEGRPFHEGWKYNGPPDTYEPRVAGKDSLSRRAFRTRLQLLESHPNTPVSGVMISDQNSQINLREWLVVMYNRATSKQSVSVFAIPLAAGLGFAKWSVNANGCDGYRVSGGVIVQRVVNKFTSTGASCTSYSVRTWFPNERRYVNIRQIINGPFALTWWIPASDPDITLTFLSPEDTLNEVDESGSSFISKVYGFENYRIKDWDPRRDGVGQLLSKPTAWYGGTTTRPRWHVVSYDVGSDAQTSLLAGITASATTIDVETILGFPDTPPFQITVDEDEEEEVMTVTAMDGAEWTVVRGQNSTAAIIHEEGASVYRLGGEPWDGFIFPYDWPEGQAYADALVARLSQPSVSVNFRVTNVNDLFSEIQLGSVHPMSLLSEGPTGGWVGDVRVRGYTNPSDSGTVELILDWLG